MSDNIVEITETSNYSIVVDTSLIQNNNNIEIQLSSPNTIDIINNTTILVGDLPQGYPLDWTTGDLPISRVSGLDIVGNSGISVTDNSGIYTISLTDPIIDSGDIIDFGSAVSGLLPVKNISSGSGIGIVSTSGNFIVSVTGTFGLTGEEVDNRVYNLLDKGSYIDLIYDDDNNLLTISATGLQPSGNYSIVGHTHIIADVSGLQNSLDSKQPSGSYAPLVHTHSSSDITDFTSAVSGLIPPSNFTSLTGISGIIVTNSGTNYFVGLNDATIQLVDITDLSTDARTFLLTPSSNNLQTLINNETGSGLLVFNDSPSFSGIPTAPTAPSGTNTTQIANTSFVRSEIANLVDSSPSTLDTLNELAAALGDDPNFATTIASGLANKAPLVHNHLVNDITDFNSGVSGLLPITKITGSSGIIVSNSGTVYNVSSSGLAFLSGADFNSLSVTGVPVSVSGHLHDYNDIINWASGIENEVSTLLVAGNYININYDNIADTVTISATGLQPSGNYAPTTHSHGNISNSGTIGSVSGLLVTTGTNGILTTSSGISSSYITDFNSSVSGLIIVKDIFGGSGINISSTSGIYTVSTSGVSLVYTSGIGLGSIEAIADNSNIASGDYSVVNGGQNNTIYGSYSNINGGNNNSVSGVYSVINGGGSGYVDFVYYGKNTINGNWGSICGGADNTIDNSNFGVICGGQYNTIDTSVGGAGSKINCFIGGGNSNLISGNNNAICGGAANSVTGQLSIIGGGQSNNISGYSYDSTIGGGNTNIITNGLSNSICGGQTNSILVNTSLSYPAYFASIVGGVNNTVSVFGRAGFVGGGQNNIVTNQYGVICGGFYNNNDGTYSFIGGGQNNTINADHGTICGGYDNLVGLQSSICGGYSNACDSIGSFIGGGKNNNCDAIITPTPPDSPYSYSVIGGGYANNITSSGVYSFVGGGNLNYTNAPYTILVGGKSNNIYNSEHSIILGGESNTIGLASGLGVDNHSCILGGENNTITSPYSSILGGYNNKTSGPYSIAGGYEANSTSYGQLSLAAGSFANPGDAQKIVLVARTSTTDSTPDQPLYLDGSSVSLTIPAQTMWTFIINISAINDTDDAAWWIFRGGIKHTAAGVTSIVGSLIEDNGADSNLNDISVIVDANDTTESLDIKVTGNSSNIRWVATIDISQVSYGNF